jgi:NAD/NADP transhydrogenase alpha subunit
LQNLNGVKIIGYSNLSSFVSDHASFALSNNLINFIIDFYDKENAQMNFDLEDEIIKSSMFVKDGKILKKEFN